MDHKFQVGDIIKYTGDENSNKKHLLIIIKILLNKYEYKIYKTNYQGYDVNTTYIAHSADLDNNYTKTKDKRGKKI